MATPLYVPGLPAKRAALAGFQRADLHEKKRVQPLWTIPPRIKRKKVAEGGGGGLEPDDPVQLAQHLRKISGDIGDKHGLHPGWVDARNAEDSLDLVVEHVWQEICTGQFGCELRPVTGPERDPLQQIVAAEAAQEWGNGLGVRVRLFARPEGELREQCRRLVVRLRRYGLPLDLLLDLYEVGSVDKAVVHALRSWSELGALAEWRTVALLGGSFPWGSKQLKDHDLTEVLRAEREVWQAVRHRLEPHGTHVTFGDYSVVHPRSGDEPPLRLPFVYEKPRYTTAEHLLVGKGARRGTGEESRMQMLAERIVGDPEFRMSRSAGELWLQDQADATVLASAGNPEVWVKYGHIQHITYMADQLRELTQ
ncbi:hypothetical protein ABZ656_20310 [Streptomyces sp. NPDC007095]|uniref:beta family protein n=1 Tax=Streptomyces sp. NPDC007095 TaxID=3154482 RepID=UPI0033C02530